MHAASWRIHHRRRSSGGPRRGSRRLRRGAVQIKVMAGGGASSEYDPLYVAQYTTEEIAAAYSQRAMARYGSIATFCGHATGHRTGARCVEMGHPDRRIRDETARRAGVFLSTNVGSMTTVPPGLTETSAPSSRSAVRDRQHDEPCEETSRAVVRDRPDQELEMLRADGNSRCVPDGSRRSRSCVRAASVNANSCD